jgi:AhpD family alkylhydroperoxidase
VWQLTKQLELSETTALPPKTKALISLAVAAQIPCEYCVYADTLAAKRAGANDEEIAEAVAMAGLTRNMSTIFNGLQIDFTQFKKEMGGS